MLGAICAIDAGGGAVAHLSRDPAGECCAAWSPDGGQIAFLSLRSGKPDIVVMDRRGGSQRNLTMELGSMMPNLRPPEWSPDGRYIVGVSRTFTASRIDLLPSLSTDPRSSTSPSTCRRASLAGPSA